MRISDWSSDVCSSDLMRQRTLAFFDDTQQHFYMAGADGFGADQASVQRAGVVGGVVAGHFGLAHQPAGKIRHAGVPLFRVCESIFIHEKKTGKRSTRLNSSH